LAVRLDDLRGNLVTARSAPGARQAVAARGAGRIMRGREEVGKGRGGKGRDTGGGRAPLPLSHGAYGGEGALSALRRGEWRRRPWIARPPGGVEAKLARAIEGIGLTMAKVLCLLV